MKCHLNLKFFQKEKFFIEMCCSKEHWCTSGVDRGRGRQLSRGVEWSAASASVFTARCVLSAEMWLITTGRDWIHVSTADVPVLPQWVCCADFRIVRAVFGFLQIFFFLCCGERECFLEVCLTCVGIHDKPVWTTQAPLSFVSLPCPTATVTPHPVYQASFPQTPTPAVPATPCHKCPKLQWAVP